MSTVTLKRIRQQKQIGGVPFGNKTALKFTLETNSSGVIVDSNLATALQVADKVYLGILPAGAELHDALAALSDAFTASVTHDIGFEYVDGVDDTDVPQDADYFFNDLANSVGRTRANNTGVRPVKLPKEAYLVATVAGAAHASAGVLDIIVDCVLNGLP
jgi:hypothetical protein